MDWAPAVIALVGYGLVRAGVVVWVVGRGGVPESALGWSGAVSGLAAAGQVFAGAALLAVVRRRRPLAAWIIAALGVGPAVVDAALWVALGSPAASAGYAWQMVLAVVVAVAVMVLCRSGFEWLRRDPDGYDLRRISRVLGRVAVVAVVVAAAAGVATLVVDQPVFVERLLRLVAVTALAGVVSAGGVWLLIIGEQRRQRREARTADMYRRLNDAQHFTDQ